MKAVIATKEGAKLVEMPQPEAGADQLLVRVHAAALNRADLRTLQLGQDDVIGMEWAGEVGGCRTKRTRFPTRGPGDVFR